MRITDWDEAYKNAAYIDGADAIFASWGADAAAFRAKSPPEILRYGPDDRQVIDLFMPKGAPRGLVVFIHGGYWMENHWHNHSHLAAGCLSHGHAVALPGYRLAPTASIPEITQDMAGALCLLAGRVAGPIHLVGHSAGGHLVTRLACRDVLPDEVADRIAHVMSISGVHDLRPLLRTAMNQTLRLTEETAAAESPALLRPRDGLRLSAVVGADERPEFLRQTDLIANIWSGLGAECSLHHIPRRHHFDIIDGLAKRDGDLVEILLAET